jgi:TP901 family phage tail tape measure protein
MAKSTSRSIYLDQTAAEVALEKLNKQVEKLEATIKRGNKAGKDMTEELKKLGEKKTAIDEIKNAIDKGLRPSLIQQEQLVRNLRNELKRMSEDAPRYAEKFQAYRNATSELNRMKVAMDGTSKAQSSWFAQAKTVALGVVIGNTVQAALSSISGYLSGLLQGNARLSDELADIEKTSGLSAAQVAKLNSELSKLDTRTSTSNLREIAIGLGQLGQAVTAENVAAIDKIVVALGDEFGGGAREITTVLSILRNNLKDIKSENYGEDVARIGNALNILGAEGLATAPVVTDFANRMAGVAGTFKITSGEILGTAATFQELGINVERGSTAFIKILQKITAEPQKFAQVAGLSVKEFTKLVNEDLLSAFVKVAEGAKIAGRDNVTFGKILKELDADGSGAGEVLSKIAQNSQLLSEKVKLANTALTNTNSITEEFNKKNTTLGAELDKLGKRIAGVFANSALSNFLKDIVRGVSDVIQPTKTATQRFDELTKSVNNLEKNILPLADRYDVLKAKTNLSKTEQAEMKGIVDQIISVLPGAAAGFDEYGRAIAISTERVRDFIAAEKARLKVVNAEAIKENQKSLAEVERRIVITQRLIDQIAKTGTFKTFAGSSGTGGGGGSVVNANQEEVRQTQELYQQLIEQRLGYNQEIKRLNGELIQEIVDSNKKSEQQNSNPPTSAVPTFTTGSSSTKKDPRIDLLNKLKELQLEIELAGKSGDEKELQRIRIKYAKLIDEAIAYSDIVIELEKLRSKEVAIFIEEVTRKQEEEKKKQEQLEREKTEKLRAELMRRKEAELNDARQRGLQQLEINNRNELATVRLRLVNSPAGQARLRAQLDLLELERDQELQNVNLTEQEKELIRAQYRQRAMQLELEFYAAQVQQILNYTQQILSVVDQFYQAQSSRENARLERELKQNDQRRTSFKRMLDARIISEAEYNRKVQQLNEEDDRKKRELQKKQFNRQKAVQISMAIINGAMAVTSTLAAVPGAADILSLGALRAIQVGLAIASTIAQVAVIAAQKPPEFERGGIARGGRHSEGGIDMIDRRSRRVVGNMEGGEPYMILSRETYRNNGDVIDELLDASMNRGGERIRPERIRRFWESRPYSSMNYSRASSSLRKRYFETGGVVDTSGGSSSNEEQNQRFERMEQVMLYMAETVSNLNQTLAAGIEANVSLKKFRDAEALDAQIAEDSTFKP